LCSLLFGEVSAQKVVSSDRFLLRILDQAISLQDFHYQSRNLKALNCVYPDAYVIQYFQKSFIKEWNTFLDKFPKRDEEVSKYMHQNADELKKIRHFFKLLR